MSVGGKWRITEMPDFEADYPDMIEPAYILFEHNGGGEFAFGCCTGHIWQASDTEASSIDFSWDGSDEMTEVWRWLRRTPVGRLPPGRNLLPTRRRILLHPSAMNFFNSLLMLFVAKTIDQVEVHGAAPIL